MSKRGKPRETENRLVVARGRGEGGIGNDYSFSVGDENILKLDNGDGCTTQTHIL